LAEAWNGTSWTIQPTPNAAGALDSFLVAVSCTSPTECTAVGGYNNSSGQEETLAETWDGTAWTIQPTPNPAGSLGSDLSGVSCTSATACTAVGAAAMNNVGSATLAEVWNGTTWSIQPTPNPAGAYNSPLIGVSCTSNAACTAVGHYHNGGGNPLTLAEAWNGATWAIEPTPNPAGAQGSLLSNVSCTSATACTAVGYYMDGGGNRLTLAQTWDGKAWADQPTAEPTGSQGSSLQAVSCTSATACTAVGNYATTSGQLTLAERYS
jgi:hypothetical protein